MSIVQRVYNLLLKVKQITERKTFQYSLLTFLTFLAFFGTLNAYAASSGTTSTGVSPDWEGTKTFHNEISGTDADEDNMNSRQGLEVLNGGWTALSVLAPELTELGPSVVQNPNIPYDLKRGLLGMTEDAVDTVYAAYPTVNIPEHLAQQWVPGYKENSVGLYAANSSSGHLTGYEELTLAGIVPLWTNALNLSYIFFVMVMIVAGFMIMFRHKLGGQTMVTLGTVLPKVIVSLILATFSFFIAGLVIDIGGVLTGLVSFILGLGADILPISTLGNLMKSVLTGGLGMTTVVSGIVGTLGLGTFLALNGLGAIGGPITFVLLAGAVGIIGIIIMLVIVGVILTGAIKVLITLYKAYFSLLLNVILGPIQITLGAIPGNSNMINNWFLSILRNVLVFPVVLFLINIPNALAAAGSNVLLRFPGKLVYEDPATYDATGVNVAAGIFLTILKVFVLFFAAQTPKFLETWLPANSSRAMEDGIKSGRESISKIPLIGGLFK